MTEVFADFGLRDWLLILGPIFIAGILIHGYWRMRSNRNQIRMALDKSFVSDMDESLDDEDELTMLRAELPNGGARVREPQQVKLDLKDDVPTLSETVVAQPESKQAHARQVVRAKAAPKAEAVPDPIPEAPAEQPKTDQSEPLPANLPEKYMVINVMAVAAPFKGQELLECLVDLDMALGEMNIFHRMRDGRTLFSLMNAVEPGSFDLNTINDIETPAVSLFMRVHELHKPGRIFNEMLEVGAALAEALGGEVRDETRSVMTSQTVEHCRQELAEYELKNPT